MIGADWVFPIFHWERAEPLKVVTLRQVRIDAKHPTRVLQAGITPLGHCR